MSKVSPTLSPCMWMVVRAVTVNGSKAIFFEGVREGFTKSTEAKAYKDELKEEGLKIIPYYE